MVHWSTPSRSFPTLNFCDFYRKESHGQPFKTFSLFHLRAQESNKVWGSHVDDTEGSQLPNTDKPVVSHLLHFIYANLTVGSCRPSVSSQCRKRKEIQRTIPLAILFRKRMPQDEPEIEAKHLDRTHTKACFLGNL